MADQTLDARGMICPMPVLKARKALASVAAGGTLEVVATDPGTVTDIPALCKKEKAILVEQSEAAGIYRFLIQKPA